MALIKRDSKPTNPETVVMLKLYEKLNEAKCKSRYFD